MRIELFGDEIDSMRWFSTFTQRSLGEAERMNWLPGGELDAEHRGLATEFAAERQKLNLPEPRRPGREAGTRRAFRLIVLPPGALPRPARADRRERRGDPQPGR